MREIKFRAWDKVSETMSPSCSLNQLLTSATRLGVTLDGSMILMQYTGLHDKNGVEMYEGDIVSLVNGSIQHVIEWNGANAAYEARPIKGTAMKFMVNAASRFVVIGNFYENPELRTKEDN